MGLLLEDGTASAVSITALSLAFAGLLLDDACDFYQNYARAQDEFQCLFAAAEHAGGRQRFLPVCRQYHELCRPLPDPVVDQRQSGSCRPVYRRLYPAFAEYQQF